MFTCVLVKLISALLIIVIYTLATILSAETQSRVFLLCIIWVFGIGVRLDFRARGFDSRCELQL